MEEAGLRGLTRVMGRTRAERIAGIYRDRVLPVSEAMTYSLSSTGRESRRRLERLAGKYSGGRCFILGNGPSMKHTNLALLRDEYTFGLNRGYLLFDRIGGPTTFLVAVNRHVVEQFAGDLASAGPPLFVGWRSRRLLPETPNIIYVRRAPRFTFSENAARGISEGPTVTYMAMQLAFHMGFRQVVLVGVDHSFSSSGPANELVTSQGADRDHFDPAYFGQGVRWQLPDLEMSEVVYGLANQRFIADGRAIVDATVGGQLSVFPKATLEDILAAPAMRTG